MPDIKVIIVGASGRMGVANIRAVVASRGVELYGAIERKGAKSIGQDAGQIAGLAPTNIKISDNISSILKGADAIIDFSTPMVSVYLAELAAKNKIIHIIGTTGFSANEEQQIQQAANNGATIVKSGNMSLGINLLASLVKKAASVLGDSFDIEIVEMHHRKKVDAPSGTALLLGEAAAKGRNIDLSTNSVRARDGIIGERETGTIGFATLRGGSVIGEHSVIFAGSSERIELTHKAEDRGLFANGAIRAVLWAKDKPHGLYSMQDVLDL